MAANFDSIARPYAVAAFELAKEADTLALWSEALVQLANVIADEQVKALITNPAVSDDTLVQFLSEFVTVANANGAASTHEHLVNFIKLLAEKGRLLALPALSKLFEGYLAAEAGYVRLKVTSAYPLTSQDEEKIADSMRQQLNSEVQCEFDSDPGLLGGFLVRSENWVLDSTISGKLKRLEISMRA